MKIISANVNGINNAKNRGFLEFIEEEDPDIIAIQEIKTDSINLANDLINIYGYDSYFYCSESKNKNGVAVYSKITPNNYKENLNIEVSKEGRLQRLDFDDFILINCLCPSGVGNIDEYTYKLLFIEYLFEYVVNLRDKSKNIILCGDFNIAHDERDVYFSNNKMIGFKPEERKLISKFLDEGFFDAFRLFHEDSGYFTWRLNNENQSNKNTGLRLDYFFINDEIENNVIDSYIIDYNLSDHSQIVLDLDFD